MNKTTSELLRIAKENDGILRAEDVVEAARLATSPLHGRFTWDDTEAAHQYRLEQARKLIQVTIQVVEGKHGLISARVFVSMKHDRMSGGGGYRTMVSVLSNAEMRRQLIKEAYEEMEFFQKKFKDLEELKTIFLEMDRVKVKLSKKQDLIAA